MSKIYSSFKASCGCDVTLSQHENGIYGIQIKDIDGEIEGATCDTVGEMGQFQSEHEEDCEFKK